MTKRTFHTTRPPGGWTIVTLLLLASASGWAQPTPTPAATASSAVTTPTPDASVSATDAQTPAPTGTPTQAWQPNVRRTAKPSSTPQAAASPAAATATNTPRVGLSAAPLPSPVPEGLPVEKRRQLLYFRMPESRDCMAFEGKILADPGVKTAMAMLSMEQINMDSGDPRIGRLRIMRAPSFIVMRPDGTEIARHVGGVTTEQFLALLTK